MRDIRTSVGSVNQAAPCASTASPTGSTLFLLFGKRCNLPSRIMPTASANPIVNHTVPSGDAATVVGMSLATVIGYSTKSPPGPCALRDFQNTAAATMTATTTTMMTTLRAADLLEFID